MLQKYDTLKSTSLLALAAAGGLLLAPIANADTGCALADGYGSSVTAFVAEADACIAASETSETDFADELFDRVNKDRGRIELAPLERRASLDKAALAHALDMAARDYAAHEDKEGRGHLFRIRALDRTMLVGSVGANVLITEQGADAGDIYVAMQEDPANADNLTRDGFTDTGIAVIRDNGRTYTVQIFASVEGELKKPLPLTLTETTQIRATLKDNRSETIGWGLTDQASGDQLAQGTVPRLVKGRAGQSEAAALDIVVEARFDTRTLKGPLISGR